MAARPLAHRDVFLPAVGALIALAWISLAVWERSAYARYLHHGELAGLQGGDGLPVLAQALAYVAGWTLMTVAMMLPTVLPLVEMFRRMVRDRADRGVLAATLVLGYLAVWAGFGVAAHGFDWVLHELYEQSAWLQARPWLFSAGVLLAAGAYQFSSLKYRCLDECRSPLNFIMQHWRGGPGVRRQAFVLGVHHGAFCVGCCWALMLLMFAIGTGSVGWMLVIGAVMAIEKNMRWGRKLSAPVGVALIAWGALIALDQSFVW
jgi:predicted metal-binding membrane protein